MAKQVSKTLFNVLDNPIVSTILDKSSDIIPVVEEVSKWWKADLYSRKPTPAEYDDEGNVIATNLDLSTFLYALWDRGAVINFPEYKRLRRAQVTEGHMVISGDNRHGKLTGLTSNENVFTFGVRIIDSNVVSTDQSGHFRTFLVTGFDGNWYDGWKTISWMPDASENKFLTENKLFTDNRVIFKNFITPEKWLSFYGQYYFITKSLIDRMSDELKFVKEQVKKSFAELPKTVGESVKVTFPKKTIVEQGEKIQVDCFEVEVDLPASINEYSIHPDIEKEKALGSYEYWNEKKKYLTEYIAKFRYACRCVEKAASDMDPINHFPMWMKNCKWEQNYREPGKRTDWNRLVLTQPGVGQRGIAIRYRRYTKTETVSDKVD